MDSHIWPQWALEHFDFRKELGCDPHAFELKAIPNRFDYIWWVTQSIHFILFHMYIIIHSIGVDHIVT